MLDRAVAAVAGERRAGGGVGIACFTESTGLGEPEHARVMMAADGRATVLIGTTPGGQGHETAAAIIAGEHLGWPLDLITVVAGDSDAVPTGRNTSASRSAVEMGNAVAIAAGETRRRLTELAGGRLDVAPEDIRELVPNGLEVSGVYDPQGRRAYAAGCAAIVVAVDVETGAVQVLRHVFVHDVGRAINPTVVEGQVHGGAAHGTGYALFEEVAYDEDATPRTSGFLDYTMVTTGEFVEPETSDLDVPATSNPGGFRGAGEGATIPVAAAMATAVEDALRGHGLEIFITELPMSPERLRRQIAEAQRIKEEAKR
jgi:carbon-monoxide dehydrogenase large subunit